MKKQDGFPGQQSYVIPERIQEFVKKNPLTSDLYITDIGYYPDALHHYRERPAGVPQYILIYNLDGQGVIKTGATRHKLPSDHFFIIPRNVPHAYYALPKNPWSIYWIHFAGSKAQAFADQALKPIRIERGKTSRIQERLNLFTEIFRNLERGFSIETLEYTNLCLGYLLSSFTHLNQYRTIKEPYHKDHVNQSINYMLQHLDRKLRLEDLAEEVKLSVSHYSRLFLNTTGHSPIDYFIQLKMQQACRLLDNTSWNIGEVARELGFDDPFYFSRLFRKIMSCSPREYRKR